MRVHRFGFLVTLAALSASSAMAACQLAQLGNDWPVDMQGSRPIVLTKINGIEARFMLDTGAFYSTLWRDAVAQYHLPVTSMPGGHSYYVGGTAGREEAQSTIIKSFEFDGLRAPKPWQFLVINQDLVGNSVGVIGQNVLRMADVEYDLANGVVRFFKPVGCGRHPLAYWSLKQYSSVGLESMDAFQSTLHATAMINGHRITVLFDTGSPRSFLSLDAAERAGISPNSPGVMFLGLTGGIGPGSNKTWSAPVDTFQLGDEKVQNAHLLIQDLDSGLRAGEMRTGGPDMLLGEDFFLSHRIYVAYSQRMLYFTYNGGPLFNLNTLQALPGSAKPPESQGAASQAAATNAEQPESDAPTDADGFRRRGMAFASMREFDRAVADLTRACDLAPRDEQNHYQRGIIYFEDGQFKSALQDFNTALTLQPDDIQAHMARAELLQSHPDAGTADAVPVAKSDLDAVSRLATPDASERLTAGVLYGRLGDYSEAVGQIEQWLSHHPLKGDQATGLNSLCWLRATGNRDLQEALDDCNRALNLRPHVAEAETGTLIGRTVASDDPEILDSRALVYLRLGRLEDAYHDYASALQINPRLPTSLYGRGLAELRLGAKAQGQDDLAAAEKLDSGVAERFARMGLTP